MHKTQSAITKPASTPLGNGAVKTAPKPKLNEPFEKFTYALAAYTVERRESGWFMGKTMPGFTGEKAKWSGPFATIETVCLSIARHLATEIADRHTRSIEAYKLGKKHPLYGLKPSTSLRAR